jgi:replicative DNA helicase
MSDVLDRIPPHDLRAEQGCLGCLLMEPFQTLPEAQIRLGKSGEPFYNLRHQELWKILVEMQDSGKHIDLITFQGS